MNYGTFTESLKLIYNIKNLLIILLILATILGSLYIIMPLSKVVFNKAFTVTPKAVLKIIITINKRVIFFRNIAFLVFFGGVINTKLIFSTLTIK